MKRACRAIAAFVCVFCFLVSLWLESWLGPEEEDEDWPDPPPE